MSRGDDPNKPPLLEWSGPSPTIEPSPERVEEPEGDETVTVDTPGAGTQQSNKGTGVGALPRGWGPLPPWDLRKYTEMFLFAVGAYSVAFMVLVSAAFVVFGLGYLYGVFPVRSHLSAQERLEIMQETRDDLLETLQKEGWHR